MMLYGFTLSMIIVPGICALAFGLLSFASDARDWFPPWPFVVSAVVFCGWLAFVLVVGYHTSPAREYRRRWGRDFPSDGGQSSNHSPVDGNHRRRGTVDN